MDAMAAADADRVLVFIGAAFQRLQHTVQIGQQDVGGAHQLHVQRGVQNVAAGHALVDKAGLVRTDMFRQMRQKGDHVVLGHGLDLVDAGHVEFHVLGAPHGLRVFARDHAQVGLGIAGMGLDFEPDAKTGFRRPDGGHLGTGIARDHGGPLLQLGRA